MKSKNPDVLGPHTALSEAAVYRILRAAIMIIEGRQGEKWNGGREIHCFHLPPRHIKFRY